MSKYDLKWNEAKYKARIKEGWGQGVGANYIPWLNVRSLPSKGDSNRVNGWKTNRTHQLLSDLELDYFFLLEWKDEIIDIREQYPLLDVERAMEIANKIGVKYPVDRKSETPYVLTTDFLITVFENGREYYIARTVKPSKELEKMRVLDKFEIERRYYLEKNIDWAIVTEKDIPMQLVENISWLHAFYKLEITESLDIDELSFLADLLKDELYKSNNFIRDVFSRFDKEHNLEKGTARYLFRHLLAKKEILMDMNEKIYEGRSASQLIKIKLDTGSEEKRYERRTTS